MASERPRHAVHSRSTRSAGRFERRVLIAAFVAGAPGGALALVLLWSANWPMETRWTLTGLLMAAWVIAARMLRARVVRPLQTVANIIAAVRENDFSIRARTDGGDDALALALTELNLLIEALQTRRFTALEATALLGAVMAEIDAAVIVFDESQRLRFLNRSGERLLDQPAQRLIGQTAEAVGLTGCLTGESEYSLDTSFPGGAGKWRIRRSTFRQDGRSHHLVVVSDLSKALREEERLAWRRLIRVLGHEINNSLTPIKSIAGGLRDLLGRPELPEDWREDLRSGLTVIENRSDSLNRLMAAYSLLARLPRPAPAPVDVERWLLRAAQLETRVPVNVLPGPPLTIGADGDQLDQAAINLVRNAADAALETGGAVRISWTSNDTALEVRIEDDGLGISETANLFVPFFTTKRTGSGIGLALSRQIAEAHGGTLTLENRRDGRGAVATLRLPFRCDRPARTSTQFTRKALSPR